MTLAAPAHAGSCSEMFRQSYSIHDSIWSVPYMKRFHASISQFVFLLLFLWSAFQPLCGPVDRDSSAPYGAGF